MQVEPITGCYLVQNGEGDGSQPCDYFTERWSPAGLEEGSCHVVKGSEREPHTRIGGARQPARKGGSQPYNYKELNSTDNSVTLEDNPEIQKEMQHTDSSIIALWDPKNRTQLSYAQIPDPQTLWQDKYMLF